MILSPWICFNEPISIVESLFGFATCISQTLDPLCAFISSLLFLPTVALSFLSIEVSFFSLDVFSLLFSPSLMLILCFSPFSKDPSSTTLVCCGVFSVGA